MKRNYEVVKSEELSTRYDERYVVISKETGETLDDAAGIRLQKRTKSLCGLCL